MTKLTQTFGNSLNFRDKSNKLSTKWFLHSVYCKELEISKSRCKDGRFFIALLHHQTIAEVLVVRVVLLSCCWNLQLTFPTKQSDAITEAHVSFNNLPAKEMLRKAPNKKVHQYSRDILLCVCLGWKSQEGGIVSWLSDKAYIGQLWQLGQVV